MKNRSLDILLVEDSRTQAELIRHAIEVSGHSVRNAQNGLQALELVREKAPSLVVSDIMMPGLDGYSLCRALKGDPATRTIPFIMLTTLNEPADIIRGIECGADNFICKPFSPEVLLERIDYFLQNGELRRSQMFDLLLAVFDDNRRKYERLERDWLALSKSRSAGTSSDEAIRICAKCKKVQDDRGEWVPIEDYLRKRAGLAFTHEFCDDCGDGLMRKPSGT
ncbi:MAG TPA: response regulator [Candidatus Deferrimicrobiaceae bacterium]